MKRPSLSSRRLLSLAATAALGVIAALTFASPASAWEVGITPESGVCDAPSGIWTITWSVTNTWGNAVIHTVDTTPAGKLYLNNVEVVADKTTIPDGTTALTEKVKVDFPAGQTTAEAALTLGVKFTNGENHSSTGTITLDKSKCVVSTSPSPSPSHTPSPSPSATIPAVHTSTPSLPVTGVNAMAIAGAAVVLVGAGTGLVLFTRRRRTIPGAK